MGATQALELCNLYRYTHTHRDERERLLFSMRAPDTLGMSDVTSIYVKRAKHHTFLQGKQLPYLCTLIIHCAFWLII